MQRYLVERAKEGDRVAFNELAPALGDRLYSVAHRILRNRDLAGDVTQQTLVKVWRDLPTLRDVDRFDGWAYRLVVNASFDALRMRRGRQPHLTLLDSDVTTPDVQLSVADRDQLDRGFERLSPQHRAVLVLTYYLEYSAPEVAAVLDLPIGTVRSRLHYAKRAMRAALDADRRAALDAGGWA